MNHMFSVGEVCILCSIAATWGTLMWRMGRVEADQAGLKRFHSYMRAWGGVVEGLHPEATFPKESDFL